MLQFDIIKVKEEQAEIIPKFLKLIYGDSFSTRELYDVEYLKKEISEKNVIFYCAVDNNGEPVGIIALKFRDNSHTSIEICHLAVARIINPKNSGYILKLLILSIKEEVRTLARCYDLQCIFALATTNHDLIKHLCHTMGFVMTGIYFNSVPEWADQQIPFKYRVRDLPHTGIILRQSSLLFTYLIKRNLRPHNIALPGIYTKIIKELYVKLKCPTIYSNIANTYLEKNEYTIHSSAFFQKTIIEVTTTSDSLYEEIYPLLQQELRNGREIIHLVLHLSIEYLTPILKKFLIFGFRYCGLIPAYDHSDVLILQYIRSINRDIPKSMFSNNLDKAQYDAALR